MGKRPSIEHQKRGRLLTFAAAIGFGVLLSAVAGFDLGSWMTQAHAGIADAGEDAGVAACRSSMVHGVDDPAGALDGDNIRLVSWNIKKKSLPNWRRDYQKLTADKDLILIQEASLREDTVNDLPAVPYWSFAPGYWRGEEVTGVLTLSSVPPLSRCYLVSTEPLLRTPKATSITQFKLDGSDETLLVVNVHAVNFSLGLGTYRNQLSRIEEILSLHDGPIILSGDLNTWRRGRMRTVAEMASALELVPLEFDSDVRKTVLGLPLDHIYIRGLRAKSSDTAAVKTSDHNPMFVTLTL
jgi:endonuclease/exonuclease/phosphatase (EEP) superfamily protein YafD